MDYNGPIWVRGCYPRKERQRFIRISCLLPTLCSGTPCAPRSVWCVLLLVFCTLYSMAYVYSTVYCDYSTPCAVMHCISVHTTQYTHWFEKSVFLLKAVTKWPVWVAKHGCWGDSQVFLWVCLKLTFNGLVLELRAKRSRQFSFKTLFGYFSSIKCQNKMVTFFKAHFISIFMTFFSMGVGHCQLDCMRSSARY